MSSWVLHIFLESYEKAAMMTLDRISLSAANPGDAFVQRPGHAQLQRGRTDGAAAGHVG